MKTDEYYAASFKRTVGEIFGEAKDVGELGEMRLAFKSEIDEQFRKLAREWFYKNTFGASEKDTPE